MVEPEEMVALTQELKRLKEALGRLKKVILLILNILTLVFLEFMGVLHCKFEVNQFSNSPFILNGTGICKR